MKKTSQSLKHSMSLDIKILKQPRMTLIMITNVKMQTCVGILTLMSMEIHHQRF